MDGEEAKSRSDGVSDKLPSIESETATHSCHRVATKYTTGYRGHARDVEPLQSNFVGNSFKSMHISVNRSLKKLRTDYIDLLYVHWWDFTTSVEEVMHGLCLD
jgi:aryl-alcohol dehydrogenase-like predicted oxidoreductase